GELDRHPDGVPEEGIVEDPRRSEVVVPAHPLRRRDPGEELLVGEALIDGLAERVNRDERDDRERRYKQEPGKPSLPAQEFRPPAPAPRSGWGGGNRPHR